MIRSTDAQLIHTTSYPRTRDERWPETPELDQLERDLAAKIGEAYRAEADKISEDLATRLANTRRLTEAGRTSHGILTGNR